MALSIAGMPLYDALCHAMTTLAAGGFSPHALSIAGYENAAVEWIICVFMFLAGASFALQYRVLLGRPGVLVRDEEFRAYAAIVLVAAVCLTGFLWRAGGDITVALRHGLFQTLSILTTTGYASVDFQLWGDQARMILLTLMFIGGCAGSAAGGPKVIRHLLIRALYVDRAAADTAPARRAPGQDRRQGRPGGRHAHRPGLLPLLYPEDRRSASSRSCCAGPI